MLSEIKPVIDDWFFFTTLEDDPSFLDVRKDAQSNIDKIYDEVAGKFIEWNDRFDKDDDILNIKSEKEFWETMIKPRFIRKINEKDWIMKCYESARDEAIDELQTLYNNHYHQN